MVLEAKRTENCPLPADRYRQPATGLTLRCSLHADRAFEALYQAIEHHAHLFELRNKRYKLLRSRMPIS